MIVYQWGKLDQIWEIYQSGITEKFIKWFVKSSYLKQYETFLLEYRTKRDSLDGDYETEIKLANNCKNDPEDFFSSKKRKPSISLFAYWWWIENYRYFE